MNIAQKVIYCLATVLALLFFAGALNMEPASAPQQAVQGIQMACGFIGPYVIARMLAAVCANAPATVEKPSSAAKQTPPKAGTL